MNVRTVRVAAAALLALLLVTATAFAGKARINLLSGKVHRGARLTSLTAEKVTFQDKESEEVVVETGELVNMTFDSSPRETGEPDPADVRVILAGGDVVHGALVAGEEEQVTISSPLLGLLKFHVDRVREVRFVGAWAGAAEKPTYSAEDREDDVFVYRKNLDRATGVFNRFTATAALFSGSLGEDYPITFTKLLAIRMADSEPPKAPAGLHAILLLTDGSRITVTRVTCDGKEFKATAHGGSIAVNVRDVRAFYQKGGRFRYLSDLTPLSRKIVPWIGEVYAWDRPRFDRSLVDKPLSAGGERYQKGIGVISGTELTFAVVPGFTKFQTRIALDDAAGAEGDVIFEVWVDGERKFRSKVIRRQKRGETLVRTPEINVKGAKKLTLKVTYVDDFVMDFADWIEPMFVK